MSKFFVLALSNCRPGVSLRGLYYNHSLSYIELHWFCPVSRLPVEPFVRPFKRREEGGVVARKATWGFSRGSVCVTRCCWCCGQQHRAHRRPGAGSELTVDDLPGAIVAPMHADPAGTGGGRWGASSLTRDRQAAWPSRDLTSRGARFKKLDAFFFFFL